MPRNPKPLAEKSQSESKEFNSEVEKVAHQAAVSISNGFKNPIVVEAEDLEVGDLEFFEDMIAQEEGGKKLSVKQMVELFTRLSNWTAEDVRGLKLHQLQPALNELMLQFNKARTVPNGSGTNS